LNDPSPAKPCDPQAYYESPYHAEAVGFYLINTTPKSIDARISSRITTVIRVVRDYQINYN